VRKNGVEEIRANASRLAEDIAREEARFASETL